MEGEEGGLPSDGAASLMKDIVGKEGVDSDGLNGGEETAKLAETVKRLREEVLNYKANNEQMFAQLHDKLTHSLSEIQKQMGSNSKRRDPYEKRKRLKVVSQGKKPHYSSLSSEESSDSPQESESSRDKPSRRRRKYRKDELQGELRKIKPPTFKGDSEKGEDAEAWLLGLRKYFRICNYSSQMEASIAIHQLQGQASIWWEQLARMKKLKERHVSWKQFKKYFQQKYLSEHYYERKMREFFDLKMGSMNMEEYVKKFMELMRYVDCIKEEKIKIQRFLSGLPSFYKDRIQYDEPKTLEDAIRKAIYMYEQNKGKSYF